jgi:hypothetical protein
MTVLSIIKRHTTYAWDVGEEDGKLGRPFCPEAYFASEDKCRDYALGFAAAQPFNWVCQDWIDVYWCNEGYDEEMYGADCYLRACEAEGVLAEKAGKAVDTWQYDYDEEPVGYNISDIDGRWC